MRSFSQRRPERFIWPAVHWICLDGQVVGALVYRHWVEMFWAHQRVIRLGGPVDLSRRAFWEETFFELGDRLEIVNAWTNTTAATFPAAPLDAPVRDLTMRSLFPDRGAPAFGEAAVRRVLHEPSLILRLSDSELAGAIDAARE